MVQVLARNSDSFRRRTRPHWLERRERRQNANRRVRISVNAEVRDPLDRSSVGPARRFGRGALALIVGAGLHALILGGFVAANTIAEALREEPEPASEETAVSLIEEEGSEPEEEREPEPLPDEEPLPDDLLEPTPWAESSPSAELAPPIGISQDSTVEGGSGPAFRTGLSLGGPASTAGLAQEVLAREARASAPRQELVMTGETVDTPAKPLSSNRAPTPPARARQNGITGFVVVHLLVGKDGSVLEARVTRSDPADFFDESVLEVVRTWRFTPAVYRGEPVVMRVNQRIRFDLS